MIGNLFLFCFRIYGFIGVSIFRYEAAGDQYVGRVLSGLPIFSAKFATLPPRFMAMDAIVARAVGIAFPQLDGNDYLRKMRRVCEFCLASVVYHLDFLEDTLEETHLVFENAIFREEQLLEQLEMRVICRLPTPEDEMRPTGENKNTFLL
jgi:hypothetical protein